MAPRCRQVGYGGVLWAAEASSLVHHVVVMGVALDDVLQQVVHGVTVGADALLLEVEVGHQDAQHAHHVQPQQLQLVAMETLDVGRAPAFLVGSGCQARLGVRRRPPAASARGEIHGAAVGVDGSHLVVVVGGVLAVGAGQRLAGGAGRQEVGVAGSAEAGRGGGGPQAGRGEVQQLVPAAAAVAAAVVGRDSAAVGQLAAGAGLGNQSGRGGGGEVAEGHPRGAEVSVEGDPRSGLGEQAVGAGQRPVGRHERGMLVHGGRDALRVQQVRRGPLTLPHAALRHLDGPGHQLHVALLHVGQGGRGRHLEDGLVPGADVRGHVAQAPRGAVPLLLDVEVHLAVVLVDDVRLEAVALAVLDPARPADVRALTCTQRTRVSTLRIQNSATKNTDEKSATFTPAD